MSYVLMKALETAPLRYDKGISWLSWGKIEKIREKITEILGIPNLKILDIGVGTGEQAIQLSEKGANVTGIDISEGMLAVAQKKIDNLKSKNIMLEQRSALELDTYPDSSYDAVLCSLSLSELEEIERNHTLREISRILKKSGQLIIADEVIPKNILRRSLHAIIDYPLRLLTYLLTQTSTHPIRDLSKLIESHGFAIEDSHSFQLDSFKIIVATKSHKEQASLEREESAFVIKEPNLSIFQRMWQTIFRFLPFNYDLGIIKVGQPSTTDPVIATCNFTLTVDKVVKSLKKQQINAWVLVCNSNGINVWCGACGHHFTTKSITSILEISRIEKCVSHKNVILPQLAAPAVSSIDIKKKTGWNAQWGTIRISDIDHVLSNSDKKDQNIPSSEKHVIFKLKDRLDIANIICGMMGILLFIPYLLWAILSPNYLLPILLFFLLPYTIYGIFVLWPLLPTRSGILKVIFGSIFLQGILILIIWIIGKMNLVASLWPLYVEFWTVILILITDADGLTPNVRSAYSAWLWNHGKVNMFEFGNFKFPITPYGKLSADISKCTGCKICVKVCPMGIMEIDAKLNKIKLVNPKNCVNCRACVNRCPVGVFSFLAETEKAQQSFNQFYS